jgi:hypothetical protein
MTRNTNPLTQWAIDKIKAEYPDDVALLVATDDNSFHGDGHGESFDYYVPATERGMGLARDFIIGKVGYDLYPRTWERTERTADLIDRAPFCLGQARILYSRSEDDAERFEVLRTRLYENLHNPEFTYRAALAQLDEAMRLYQTLMFEESLFKSKMAAAYVHDYLSMAAAYLNGTYLSIDWQDGREAELSHFTELPDEFIELYRRLRNADSIAEIREIAHTTLSAGRRFIEARKPEGEPSFSGNYQNFADWYGEMRTTWNRIAISCKLDIEDTAFVDACFLQNELCVVSAEFGLPEMDLLGSFDASDLSKLNARAAEIEREVVGFIESHGAKIDRYDTVEDFLSANGAVV